MRMGGSCENECFLTTTCDLEREGSGMHLAGLEDSKLVRQETPQSTTLSAG